MEFLYNFTALRYSNRISDGRWMMAVTISCNFMRAAILELNTLCCGDFNWKFSAFVEIFGNVFPKEKFRRKVNDFTAFVRKKSFCKNEKRKEFIKKYGREKWSSLTTDEQAKHEPTCLHCAAEPDLFTDPTRCRSKRNKQNSKRTPKKTTPTLKKPSSRYAIQGMNREVNAKSKEWEEKYDTSFVEVLRKNRKLNVTPRKSKIVKAKENIFLQKKVSFI